MIRNISVLVAIFLLGAFQDATAISYMVEKNIFSPEKPETIQKNKPMESEELNKISKEITFTGVIISGDYKRAIIGEKKKNERPMAYKEGDEVNGLMIKEIHNNNVLLTLQEKEIRLYLYQGEKPRPAPPPEPVMNVPPPITAPPVGSMPPDNNQVASAPSTESSDQGVGIQPQQIQQQQSNQPTDSSSSAIAGPVPTKTTSKVKNPQQGDPYANPFAEAIRRAKEQRSNNPSAESMPTNPFLEMIRRAREQSGN
ncbi:MAG: hypothetical protein HQK77_01775 [Desulfobacterales bacterium]|nr:hypothetical protein [Desulfobacterales bacterium]